MKRIIAVYPGRFQPFGKHHNKAFEWLQEKFGTDNCYIVTSDKTEPDRSPFTFLEKRQIIQGFGIDRTYIREERVPYKPMFLEEFDEDTQVVFMLGEKDVSRFKWTKKDGSPSYFQPYNPESQMESFLKHGYVITAPHITIPLGETEYSGTEIRNQFVGMTEDIFEDIFGWYNERVYNMIKKKSGIKEVIAKNIIEGNYADPDDGPRAFYNDLKSYMSSILNNKEKNIDNWEVMNWLIGDMDSIEAHDSETDYPFGPPTTVSYFPTGDPDTEGSGTNYDEFDSMLSADDKYDAHVARLANNSGHQIVETVIHVKQSLGIPRHNMPQIADVDNFISWLSTKDVVWYEEEVDIEKINLTQKDINIDKVTDILDNNADKFESPLICANDYYIIDAHHRVVAREYRDPKAKIKVIRVDMNIKTLLKLCEDYPKVEYKTIKEILREDVVNLMSLENLNTDKLLNMGGAFGRLNHVYDNKQITFGKLKELISNSLTGKLSGPFYEKVDGQNIMVTYVDGEIKAARNKTTLKSPMSIDELDTMFKDRGVIQESFVSALREMNVAFEGVAPLYETEYNKSLNEYFGFGKKFINLEVLNPKTQNVIEYNKPYLMMLGLVEYDDNWNMISNDVTSLSEISNLLENNTNDYEIIQPIQLEFARHSEVERVNYFIDKMDSIQDEANLKDSNTLGEYYEYYVSTLVNESFRGLPKQFKEALVNRWVYEDKSVRLSKGNYGIYYELISEMDKGKIKPILNKIKDQIEPTLIEFTNEFLGLLDGYLSKQNLNEFRTEIKKQIYEIVPNNTRPLHVERHLERIKNAGGLELVLPTEGIVFENEGQLYKFTGLFGSVNQILGINRYSR